MAKTFAPGDRVAHSHIVGPEHEDGSIVRESTVTSRDAAARFGTVLEPADGQHPTHHLVQFDEGEPQTLTSDELVKVKPATPPAGA